MTPLKKRFARMSIAYVRISCDPVCISGDPKWGPDPEVGNLENALESRKDVVGYLSDRIIIAQL